MTDRLLLSFSAALGAVNGTLIALETGGVFDVPAVVMAVSAVLSIGFAAFVANFVRQPPA